MSRRTALTAILLVTSLASCVSDAPTDTPEVEPYGGQVHDLAPGMAPTGYLPDAVTGLSFASNPDPRTAYTVIVNDDVLYIGGSDSLRIWDVSDPTDPQPLNLDIDHSASHDLDIMFHPDGHVYLVSAQWTDVPIKLYDITDPANPEFISRNGKCTHNVAVIPDTTYVVSSYSACHAFDDSAQEGDTSHFAITDFSDPYRPVDHLFEFPREVETVDGTPREVTAVSCHHTTFQMDRNLMYCAGITQTLIFDISDILDPQIIQVIDWPGSNSHHAAWPAWGGDLLILGDEVSGAFGPTPTCSKDADVPTAALWFYDISDLSNPIPLGFFEQESHDAVNQQAIEQTVEDGPTDQTATYCSTHFGGFVEDQDLFIISWYNAGTYMVDFSDPTTPVQVAGYRADGPSTTMDAFYYKGYVYTADERRGLDILKVT